MALISARSPADGIHSAAAALALTCSGFIAPAITEEQPGCSSVIAGAMTPEQVKANAAASEWIPSAAELAEIDQIVPPPPRAR